jgi:hypothetical protein
MFNELLAGNVLGYLILQNEECNILFKAKKESNTFTDLIATGICFLLIKDNKAAANRLSRGFRNNSTRIVSRISTYGFPNDVVEWANKYIENLESEKKVQEMIDLYNTEGQITNLIIYLIVGLYVSDRKRYGRLSAAILLNLNLYFKDNKLHNISTKTYDVLLNRCLNTFNKKGFFKKYDLKLFNNDFLISALKTNFFNKFKTDSFSDSLQYELNSKNFNEDKSDLEYLEENKQSVQLEFETQNLIENNIFSNNKYEYIFDQEEKSLIDSLENLEYMKSDIFAKIVISFNLLINKKYIQAYENLIPYLQDSEELLKELSEKEGPKKIFVAGYGWSGSGLLYDFLRGFPDTHSMPGSHKNTPFLNEDADVEPMIHQGPGGLMSLINLNPKMKKYHDKLMNFFRMYILLGPPEDYFEYKTIHSNIELRNKLGNNRYDLIVAKLISELALNFAQKKSFLSNSAIADFDHRIFNSLFSNPNSIVLFNNSINAAKVDLLKYIKGNKLYFAVDRGLHDQYLDQKISNQFFYSNPFEFTSIKQNKLENFKVGSKQVRRHDLFKGNGSIIRSYYFEDLVKNEKVRKEICELVFGYYKSEYSYKYFNPNISIKNIGKSKSGVGIIEKIQLNISNLYLKFFSID